MPTKKNLIMGDCFEVLSTFASGSIDLIVTDPPYEVCCVGGGSVNSVKNLSKSLDSLVKADIASGYEIRKFGMEVVRLMSKEINVYFWCNKVQIPAYIDFYVREQKCKFDILCWHKTNALPTYSNKYLADTEYLLYFRKGKGKCFPKSYEDAKTFYLSPKNVMDKKLYQHPTIKPLDITEKIIRNSSEEGQMVLDPFMGSGTTGVACSRLNRNFIGIECEEKWFNIAKNRILNGKERIIKP